MYKNIFLLALLLAASVIFTGCRTDDPIEPPAPPEPIAVNLRANIVPAMARVANDQWQADDRVGLFMVHTGQPLSSASVLTNANNALMTIENGVLVSNPPVMYPLTGNVDFIAYYPFHSSVGSNFTIPVSVANQATGLATEVLFSNNITNQAPTTNAVTLNFHYSLAKLALTVTSESDTRSAMDFENMTVRIEGMYTQADLQLAGGTFVNHRARQPKMLHRTDNSATAASFEGLALPSGQSASGADAEITFVFEVNGKTFRHTMTADHAASNLYNLNFSIDSPVHPEDIAVLLNAVIIPREENTQDIAVDAE